MMNFIKNRQLQLVFLAAGGIGGFLYWKYVGCASGSCPIKSVWYWSTLAGMVLGYLVGDILSDFIRKRKQNKDG